MLRVIAASLLTSLCLSSICSAEEDTARGILGALSAPAVAELEQAEAALNAAAEANDEEAMATARQALDQASVLQGADDWLYTLSDVRHHAAGLFWGDAAAEVAAASRNPDPLPAITAMAQQASQAGVRLLVIPVPSKVRLHGAALDPRLTDWDDPLHSRFLAELESAGVEVLDLLPLMRRLQAGGHPAHLRGDSHWSPQAVEATAAAIHQLVADEEWVAALSRQETSREARSRDVLGDLASRIDGKREEITIHRVQLDGEAHRYDADSPIVLMGDSHGLVFGNRDLLTTGAGLGDHLAEQFGVAIDVTSVMGSGANASRMTLARRGSNLEGKKLLVWVFAERELSRSTSGWPVIPVVR